MREQILELVKKSPKGYASYIKNHSLLLNWILTNSKLPMNRSIPEHTYSALYDIADICNRGKRMKWRGIQIGWKACGTASNCECTRENLSIKLSELKASRSIEEISLENSKRKQTNIRKYGIENSGQLPEALKKHQEFYRDASKVSEAIEKHKKSMICNWGVVNAQQVGEIREQTKMTMMQRYGVDNPMKNSDISRRSGETRRLKFDSIATLERNHDWFVENIKERYNVIPLITANEYAISGGLASRPLSKFVCNQCNYVFEKRFDYSSPPICKVCHPTVGSFCSKEEKSIFDFIRDHYSGPMISGDRSIINPHQLDIYLPELKIAIEYCGLYWHSECGGNSERMTWNYHFLKMKKCNETGIRLITIFGDEWVSKQTIVQSKLLSLIGKNNTKVGARQCIIREVDFKTARSFYEEYHIQGGEIKAGKNIALVKDNELMAMMSFKKNRDNHELVRYATSVTVMGGASKLLRYYIDNYSPHKIISFADLRWSVGDMYLKLGFTKNGFVPPMQSYVEKYKIRHHKLKFKKHRLSDRNENETEWQYLRRLGYDRIWDCGKIKFEMQL